METLPVNRGLEAGFPHHPGPRVSSRGVLMGCPDPVLTPGRPDEELSTGVPLSFTLSPCLPFIHPIHHS